MIITTLVTGLEVFPFAIDEHLKVVNKDQSRIRNELSSLIILVRSFLYFKQNIDTLMWYRQYQGDHIPKLLASHSRLAKSNFKQVKLLVDEAFAEAPIIKRVLCLFFRCRRNESIKHKRAKEAAESLLEGFEVMMEERLILPLFSKKMMTKKALDLEKMASSPIKRVRKWLRSDD